MQSPMIDMSAEPGELLSPVLSVEDEPDIVAIRRRVRDIGRTSAQVRLATGSSVCQ